MRFSATMIHQEFEGTVACSKRWLMKGKHQHQTLKDTIKRRKSQVWPCLLVLLILLSASPLALASDPSETGENSKQHDDELRKLMAEFKASLGTLSYMPLLAASSQEQKVPTNSQRGGPPVMIGRRRNLLEHNLQEHYSIQYLIKLQENKSKEASNNEDADQETTTKIKSIDDTKRHMHEALLAYFYQSEYDAHVKANPQRQQNNAATSNAISLPPFPPSVRQVNREMLRDMFYHAYNAYMEHSFPAAELLPLTCQAGTFDLVRLPALTLIDALDTLLILGDSVEFAKSVERLRQFHQERKSKNGGIFAFNHNVSVFETTIRVLGGLLSAHQMAVAYLRNKLKSTDSEQQRQKKAKHNEKVIFDNKLPIVTLKDVYSSTDEDFLQTPEDVERILLEHQVHETNNANTSPDSDGTCNLDGASTTNPQGPIKMENNHGSDGASGNLIHPNLNNPNDWHEHCGAGLLSLEDCAASKASKPKPFNQTAARLRKLQQLQKEPLWEYDGFLLDLALDIGERLLPAFDTKTGIPYGTVNLMSGVPRGETSIASLAGGGTLSMEMELLSRLTGDARFGKAAKLATRALWMRRSPLNLVGKHIDTQRGTWTESLSGIGSNSDSFLEYLLKHYLVFPEEEDFWIMLQSAYSGIFHDSRLGEWYADVDMKVGLQKWPKGIVKSVLESLMAFYPGMQTLMGEFVPAARSLNSFFIVREYLGFLPERFSYSNWKVDGGISSGAAKYPLRPELLESCYFMHRTTKKELSESSWQWAADFALHHLERLTTAKCGFASVRGLSPLTGHVQAYQNRDKVKLSNDMPSFFLSETIKYLYLTFDDDNIIHRDKDRDWIFTTEAHPIHFVPTFDEQEESESTHGEDSARLSSVKDRLRKKLNLLKYHRDGDAEGHKSFAQRKSVPASAASSYYISEELWSDITQPREFRKSVSDVVGEMIEADKRKASVGNYHPIKSFFGNVTTPLESMQQGSSELMYKEDNNLVHISWKSLGLGDGYAMRKACPNFYASELIWLHALSGGALDYTDVYVSSFTESEGDYPSTSESMQLVVTSAEALSVLGSGIFLGNMDSVMHGIDKCKIAFTAESANKTQDSSTEPPPEYQTTDVQRVDLAGVGTFEVSAFPEGSGFFMQQVETGESIMATLITPFNDSVVEDVSLMVYASMPRFLVDIEAMEEETAKDGDDSDAQVQDNANGEETGASSPWKLVGPRLAKIFHKSRKAKDQKTARKMMTEPRRSVVIADLSNNAFHCEVNIVRRPIHWDVAVEEAMDDQQDSDETVDVEPVDSLVARFPCAPALFGRTNMVQLIESNGIFLEHRLMPPQEEDEFGCGPKDEGEVIDLDDGGAESSGEKESKTSDAEVEYEEETLPDAEERSCENTTIQMVQRGHCSFFSKAANQKKYVGAAGVIVINTEDNELFVMSHGEDEETGVDEDDLPISVLVTGLDGEALLGIVQAESVDEAGREREQDSYLVAQISIFKQETLLDTSGGYSSESDEIEFPIVRGSEAHIQVYAEGGWGIHAMRKDGGKLSDIGTNSGLQLYLLRHSSDE